MQKNQFSLQEKADNSQEKVNKLNETQQLSPLELIYLDEGDRRFQDQNRQLLQKLINKNEQRQIKNSSLDLNSNRQNYDYNYQQSSIVSSQQQTMSSQLQGKNTLQIAQILLKIQQKQEQIEKSLEQREKREEQRERRQEQREYQRQKMQKETDFKIIQKLEQISNLLKPSSQGGKKILITKTNLRRQILRIKCHQYFLKCKNIKNFYNKRYNKILIKSLKQVFYYTKSYKTCLLVAEATFQICNYISQNKISLKIERLNNFIIHCMLKKYFSRKKRGRRFSIQIQTQTQQHSQFETFKETFKDIIDQTSKNPPFFSKLKQLLDLTPALKKRFENYELGGSQLYRLCTSLFGETSMEIIHKYEELFLMSILAAWMQKGSLKKIQMNQQQLQQLSQQKQQQKEIFGVFTPEEKSVISDIKLKILDVYLQKRILIEQPTKQAKDEMEQEGNENKVRAFTEHSEYILKVIQIKT